MGGDFTGIGVSRLGQTWPNLLGHRMGAVEPPVVSFLEAEAGDDKATTRGGRAHGIEGSCCNDVVVRH